MAKTKRLAFGPGAKGAGTDHYNSGGTPINMVPDPGEVSSACMTIMELLPDSHRPSEAPFGSIEEAALPIGKAAWRLLIESKVPERWPYSDNINFNPGDRARFLRALVTLDLWTFRPKRGGE